MFMKKDAHIDGEPFELSRSGVDEDCADRCRLPERADDADIGRYLDRAAEWVSREMIDDIVKRAIDYPYRAPGQSIILHEGGAVSQLEAEAGLADGDRHPVVAAGSNRSRNNSGGKFDGTGLGDIPVSLAELEGRLRLLGACRRLRRHARHTTRMPGRQGFHRRDLVGRRTTEPHARNGVAWTRLRFRDIHAGKFNHPSRSKNRQGPSLPEFTRPLRSGGSADSPGGRSGGRDGFGPPGRNGGR